MRFITCEINFSEQRWQPIFEICVRICRFNRDLINFPQWGHISAGFFVGLWSCTLCVFRSSFVSNISSQFLQAYNFSLLWRFLICSLSRLCPAHERPHVSQITRSGFTHFFLWTSCLCCLNIRIKDVHLNVARKLAFKKFTQ